MTSWACSDGLKSTYLLEYEGDTDGMWW